MENTKEKKLQLIKITGTAMLTDLKIESTVNKSVFCDVYKEALKKRLAGKAGDLVKMFNGCETSVKFGYSIFKEAEMYTIKELTTVDPTKEYVCGMLSQDEVRQYILDILTERTGCDMTDECNDIFIRHAIDYGITFDEVINTKNEMKSNLSKLRGDYDGSTRGVRIKKNNVPNNTYGAKIFHTGSKDKLDDFEGDTLTPIKIRELTAEEEYDIAISLLNKAGAYPNIDSFSTAVYRAPKGIPANARVERPGNTGIFIFDDMDKNLWSKEIPSYFLGGDSHIHDIRLRTTSPIIPHNPNTHKIAVDIAKGSSQSNLVVTHKSPDAKLSTLLKFVDKINSPELTNSINNLLVSYGKPPLTESTSKSSPHSSRKIQEAQEKRDRKALKKLKKGL